MSEQQIEQIWYTWSEQGLEGKKGLGVRAASRAFQDVQHPRMQALLPRIRSYQLPSDYNPYTTHQEDAPICLAFLKEGNELVLLQKKFLERLDDKGRAGLFFTHALVGFPPYFSAREAISLWKSTFWVAVDTYDPAAEKPLPEDAKELGVILYTPPTSHQRVYRGENFPLRKYRNGKLPALDGQEEALRFVIQAFLIQRRAQEQQQKAPKIYIAAFSDTVAALLQGLTQAFPRGLLSELTFSTYEQRVEQSPAMIVGTCRLSMRVSQPDPVGLRASLLSPAAYQGQALVLNCDTQENSPLVSGGPLEARFVTFAAENLASGAVDELRSLVKNAEKQNNIATIDAFLEFYEQQERAKKDQLSQEEVYKILGNPPRAAQFLSYERVRAIALELMLDDASWQRGVEAAMIQLAASARPGDELTTYLQDLALGVLDKNAKVVQHGLASIAAHTLREQKEKRAFVWLHRLDAFAQPTRQPIVWQFLATWVGRYPPRSIPFTDRFWLLQQWQQAKPDLDPQSIQPWLEVDVENLPGLLALRLPDTWSQISVDLLVGKDAKKVAAALARYPGLAEKLLKRLILERQKLLAQNFFEEYVSHLDSDKKVGLISQLFDGSQKEANITYFLLRVAHLNASELSALLAKESVVFQHAFSLLADHDWWQNEGRKILAEMREQADTGQKPQQAAVLDQLEKPVYKRLKETLSSLYTRPQEELSEKMALDTMELLAFSAPPSQRRETWLDLLKTYVSKESATHFSWAIRSQLLSYWAMLSPLPAQQAVQPWLEVSVEELDALFQLTLDKAWYMPALLALLDIQLEELCVPFNQQAPVDVVGVVNKYSDRFEELLLKVIKDHAGSKDQERKRRRQVASFFSSLAASGYPRARKMRLFYALLSAGAEDRELIELLLYGVSFSAEELREFVEDPYVMDRLIHQNPLSASLVWWVVHYLRDLSAQDCGRLVSRDLKPLSILMQGISREPVNQQGWLSSAFAELGTNAQAALGETAGETVDESLVRFWLRILEMVAPPVSHEDTWRSLARILGPARPHLSPTLRYDLLRQWAMIPWDDFGPLLAWLQVPWQELDNLLSCALPSDWYQVTRLALVRGQSAPLDQREVGIFAAHVQDFVVVLQNLIQETTPWSDAAHSYLQTLMQEKGYREVAVHFFWQLAVAPVAVEDRLNVLIQLLQSAAEQPTTVDRLLQGAQLRALNEAAIVLEAQEQWFVPLPDIPKPLADWLQHYLGNLHVDALWQPGSSQLLDAVLAMPGKNTSTKLSHVQSLTRGWRLVGRFLEAPTLEKEALETLASAFQYLPADRMVEVFAVLARALAASIWQEEQLRLVLSTLGPCWKEHGVSLLQQLVACVGGASAPQQSPPGRLALYAQAVCVEAAAMPTPDQREATLDLLDTLLASVGKGGKIGIDEKAEGWSSEEARAFWQAYRRQRPPRSRFMRGLHFLGAQVAQFPFFREKPARPLADKAVPPVKDFPRRSIRPDQVAVPDTAAATAQEDESQQTTSTRNQPLAAARYDLADIQARAAQSLGKTSGRIAPPIDQNSSSGEIAGGGVPPNGSGAGTLVSDEATLKPLLNRSTRSGKPALRQQLSGRLRTWQGRLIFCLFMIAFIFVLGALFWYVIQLLVFLF